MGLRQIIATKIANWLAKEPDLEKALSESVSSWLAKQPGAEKIEVPMRCPACSYEWTVTADLTKGNLADAVRQFLRCPICGAQPARLRR